MYSADIVAYAGLGARDQSSLPVWKQSKVSDGLLPGMCNSGGNPTWPKMGGADGFNYTRNIVLLQDGPLQVGTPASAQKDDRNTHWSGNTYWSANESTVGNLKTAAVWPNGTTLSEWAASKYVAQGANGPPLIADPMFKDPQNRDFTVQPGSPALKRGFAPFEVIAGCMGNPFTEDVRQASTGTDGRTIIPGTCHDTLVASCSTNKARAHSPFAQEPCAVCCGHLQRQLRLANCSHADITNYCDEGDQMQAAFKTESCSAPFDCVTTHQVPVPVPAGDEALLRVAASSVNPCDTDYVEGTFKGCSGGGGTLGMDVAGTVVRVGGSCRLKVGDRVWADLGAINAFFAQFLC